MDNDLRQVSDGSTATHISLPPRDDPVITSALKASVAHSRASSLHNMPIGETIKPSEGHPFRRWLGTLHRRNAKKEKVVHARLSRWKMNEFEDDTPSPNSSKLFPKAPLRHRKSTSWASGSTALLAGTRSAFASLSILSEHPRSTLDGSVCRGPKSRRSDRGSMSIEMDVEGLRERATKRRQTIDEIVRTESEYILSLRALDNLYSSVCLTAEETLRSDMDQMQNILEKLTDLHHELSRALNNIRGANRAIAEPGEALELAKVFEKFMGRFFLYEEYTSKYEEMLRNVGLASQNIPDWENYQRGFEMLSNSITPTDQSSPRRKKSLTFGDLHMKPIQRVCKYPLLFSDLCKYTPVIDGPEEHLEVEKILFRLRDTVMEINQATVDPKARERMQQSWKLQDMLTLPDPIMTPHTLRGLGPVTMCGALYIVYHSGKAAQGEYMLCALFKSYLMLAIPIRKAGSRKYRVVASIALANIKLHNADSEFGLQCLTAPHVWKILFEVDSAIFEILVAASSIAEQERWTQAICENADKDTSEHDRFSMIALGATSIGEVMGKPGSLLRAMAMKEINAAKLQVIIKSTSIESPSGPVTLRERISHPVLTPKRADRARIEQDIDQAGCRDAAKEASSQKSRHLKRSASTLLRKLSRSSKRLDELA